MTIVIIYDNIGRVRMEITMKGKDISDGKRLPRYEVVEELKKARREQHMTQEALAELVGTKKSNISRFESGKYNPSLDFLIKVADCLGKQLRIELVKL